MSAPSPPVNVQLEMADGTVLAVDTVYVGFSDGTHTWAVLNCPPTDQIRYVHVDELPGNTTITFIEGFTGS
jgi:hypothetical protein